MLAEYRVKQILLATLSFFMHHFLHHTFNTYFLVMTLASNVRRLHLMAQTTWLRVKQILDTSLERWKAKHGRDPKMRAAHEGHIGWETKEELATSAPYDKQLIEAEKIGNGRAEETNLIRILRGPIGGYRRMPSGGPYLTPDEINEIAEWINEGMPD